MKLYRLIIIFGLILLFNSCKKEEILGDEYLRVNINGEHRTFGRGGYFNPTGFQCSYSGDTSLFIYVSYGSERLLISLDSTYIRDGFHKLSTIHYGEYENPKDGFRKYRTNANYTGTITFQKSVYQTTNYPINVLVGQFSFQAIDTGTGKTINIYDGDFRMKRE